LANMCCSSFSPLSFFPTRKRLFLSMNSFELPPLFFVPANCFPDLDFSSFASLSLLFPFFFPKRQLGPSFFPAPTQSFFSRRSTLVWANLHIPLLLPLADVPSRLPSPPITRSRGKTSQETAESTVLPVFSFSFGRGQPSLRRVRTSLPATKL